MLRKITDSHHDEATPVPRSAAVAETCLAFSEAATEEANASAHFRLGTIQDDEYSARLQKAKMMFQGVPVDAETELGMAVASLVDLLAESGPDGLRSTS